MKKTNFKVNYMNDEIADLTSKCEQKMLAIWAADCAEHVLSYFEEKYPQDNRPRKAIEAGRAWVRGELKMTEARKAALTSHAAAREASDDSATAAARAAGHAAGTAHVAGHAPHAATYAAKAVGYAKYDINQERDWQYNHLLELYKNQNS
jgi:hypothetical protein